MIKRLKWDSSFFGIEIGEWHYDEKNFAPDHTFDLIYVKRDKELDLRLSGYVNSYSEIKLVFNKTLTPFNRISDNIVSVTEADYLYELAYESGKFSRFRLDERIGIENFKRLYRTWVDNSLNRQFADDVLAYIENDKIIGFITYKKSSYFAVVGLIAVSQGHQGKGIGRKLLRFVEGELVDNGIFNVQIPTQIVNTGACAFYEKEGYEIIESTHIKHYWKT